MAKDKDKLSIHADNLDKFFKESGLEKDIFGSKKKRRSLLDFLLGSNKSSATIPSENLDSSPTPAEQSNPKNTK